MKPANAFCCGIALVCVFSTGIIHTTAEAGENSQRIESATRSPHPHRHHFDVYYLPSENDRWRLHSSYDRLADARNAASLLEQNGFLARIRHHR